MVTPIHTVEYHKFTSMNEVDNYASGGSTHDKSNGTGEVDQYARITWR